MNWRPAHEWRGLRRIKPCAVTDDKTFDRYLAPVMFWAFRCPANDTDGKRW